MLDADTLADVMDMLPDPITVTYTPFNGNANAPFTIAGARSRPVDKGDLDWGGNFGVTLASRAFLLPVANMAAGYEVVQNDLLTDDKGQKWNIVAARLEMQQTTWRAFGNRAPS